MILVTGAGKGLGLEVCKRFISQGHEVAGISRNGSSDLFQMYKADVGDYEALRTVASDIKKSGSEVTGLINAAGIASMNLALLGKPQKVHDVIRTNLEGTIYSCQIFAPLIIRAGGGGIVNFSTIAVSLGLQGESVYAASKSGVETFSRVLARELSAHNIRVNCVAPGPIQTDLLSGVTDTQIEKIIQRQIINKRYAPHDVADLVELLFDNRAQSLSGQVLNLGGV